MLIEANDVTEADAADVADVDDDDADEVNDDGAIFANFVRMASLIGEDSRKLALDISDAADDDVAPDAGAAVAAVVDVAVVIDLSSTLGSGSGEKETNVI